MISKKALIVGTATALSEYKSGASIRVNTVKKILEQSGYEVTLVSNQQFAKMPNAFFDLIVVVSFAAAQSLKKARVESNLLWLDATDSWHQSRISRIKSGEFIQLFALLRDFYRLNSARDLDLITFISRKDAARELRFTNKRGRAVYVFPNYFDQTLLLKNSDKRLVFVGDGNFGPNRKAIKFLKKVRRLLDENEVIYLIGRNLGRQSKGFITLGNVSDLDLYKVSDIHLAPVFSGSGIKNKVAEPLFYGLPVITTLHGSNGIKQSEKLIIRKTPKQFADAISKTLQAEFRKELDSIFELDETERLLLFLRMK